MPETSDWEARKEENMKVKLSNPKIDWKILDKVGSGGFATIFKVERREDKMIAAIKAIKYSEKATRPKMLNELAIMRDCSNRSNTML